MSSQCIVRMGEMVVTDHPESMLTALGLGSCIGICLYDPYAKISGMAHVVLPKAVGRVETMPAKSMEIAFPNLLKAMKDAGAQQYRLKLVLAGGAQLFTFNNASNHMDIGVRNISAAMDILNDLHIKPVITDVGGTVGRTVSIYTDTGIVTMRKAGGTDSVLADLSVSGSSAHRLKVSV